MLYDVKSPSKITPSIFGFFTYGTFCPAIVMFRFARSSGISPFAVVKSVAVDFEGDMKRFLLINHLFSMSKYSFNSVHSFPISVPEFSAEESST